MKRKNLILAMIALIAYTTGCQQTIPLSETKISDGETEFWETSETEPSQISVEDDNMIVWRIDFPAGSENAAKEMAHIWQNPLNEMLKSKGADYTVRIEPIDKGEPTEMLPVSDELTRLKETGEQTDVISILPVARNGEELFGYHLAYPDCAEKGLLLPLEPFLNTEKGMALQASVTEHDLERAKLNGTIYGISAVLPSMNATVYSEEQMEKYHIKAEDLKSSVFENENLFQKVKELSGSIPYGIISGDIRLNLGLYMVSPCENLAQNKEGKFVNITETQEFRNYLQKLADWKKKGLVEQTDSIDVSREIHFAEDTLLTGQNYSDKPYHIDVKTAERSIPVYVLPDETSPVIEPYWGDNKLCIASWTKNRQKAEDFLTRLMTDAEIANLIQYGREGIDYALHETTVGINTNTNILLRVFGYQYTNPLITYPTATMAEDKLSYAKRHHDSYETKFPDGFRFDPVPVLKQIVQTNQVFNNIGGSETAEKIFRLEIEDTDQIITDITKELKEAGIDKIVEEANRQYHEWKKEQE